MTTCHGGPPGKGPSRARPALREVKLRGPEQTLEAIQTSMTAAFRQLLKGAIEEAPLCGPCFFTLFAVLIIRLLWATPWSGPWPPLCQARLRGERKSRKRATLSSPLIGEVVEVAWQVTWTMQLEPGAQCPLCTRDPCASLLRTVQSTARAERSLLLQSREAAKDFSEAPRFPSRFPPPPQPPRSAGASSALAQHPAAEAQRCLQGFLRQGVMLAGCCSARSGRAVLGSGVWPRPCSWSSNRGKASSSCSELSELLSFTHQFTI